MVELGGTAEDQLPGGVANAGRVVRVGPHVLRPGNPYTHAIHRFLSTVREGGFAGVPLPLGVEADGRERLMFVDGDVPVPPYPDWAQTDAALRSITLLLAGFHRASSGFDPAGLSWSEEMADPAGGSIVCHHDVCLENVVFRGGEAVSLPDFEFAAPGRPIFDLAQFARMCVPIDDEINAARLGWRPADLPARLRLVADTYGLDGAGRRELIGMLTLSIDRGGEFVRRRVEAGDPNFTAMWNEMGGEERFDRRCLWWHQHLDHFAAALL